MTDRAEELAREWAGDAPYHATKWTPIQATFGDVVELIHRVQEESAKPRDQADELAREAAAELRRARSLCGPMRGPHEGWAVIFEELDELWDEVKAPAIIGNDISTLP